MTGNSGPKDRIEGGADGSAQERALDAAAVRRCLAGDRDAFGELVTRWQDRIHAVIHRMTGDADLSRDLAQETFLRAWSSLAGFEGGAAFGTWLHAIALNQVRSEMRKRAAQKRGTAVSFEVLAAASADAPEGASFEPAGPDAPPSARLEAGDRSRVLREAIARLDPEFREVLVLREFRDLPYEEIAAITGAPVGTVRSRLFRARSELRRLLEGRV